MARPLVFVSLLLTLALGAGTADAQKRKPSEQEQQARAHYKKALSYYNLREYTMSIIEFKEAYSLSEEPMLLFNIAQAYRLSRQNEEALHYYSIYLRLKPNAPNRRDVEQFIAELEQLHKAEEMLNRDEVGPSAPGTTLHYPLENQPPPEAAGPPAPAPQVGTGPPHRPLYKRWWVWTIAGTTVAAVGVGLAVGFTVGNHEIFPSGSWGQIDARH
jgi:tetratricopeptide (TPR) repeat protein